MDFTDGGYGVMGAYAGPERNVSLQTTSGRSLYSLGVVQDGLVLNLDASKFYSYPRSGNTWTDLTNNGNTGTLVNGPTYSSANGGSLVFDGGDDYILLPTNSINSNADLTLNFWVNHSPISSPFTQAYTFLSGYSASSHLQVRYTTTGTSSSVQLVKSNVVNLGEFSGFTTPNNTTNFITITLAKSTNTWSLYANGSFISSFVNSQTFTTSSPVLGSSATGAELFKGNMYSFSYYNRALTATEIAQNFNATKSRYGL